MSGFMVKASDALTVSTSMASPTELTFDTVLADPDSGFASNRFTVPASWHGLVGRLCAGYRSGTINTNLQFSIERSTDSGSTWVPVGTYKLDGQGLRQTIITNQVVFATGNLFRCSCAGTDANRQASPANFFGGWLSPSDPSKLAVSKFGASARITPTANVLTTLAFDSAETDAAGLLRTGGGIEVPSGFGDCWGVFFLNFETNFQSSTTTGYIVATLASGITLEAQNGAPDTYGRSITLGPVPMVEGDYVLPQYFSNQNLAIETSYPSNFSGFLMPRSA
jgi:hypothetical protein